MRLDERIKTVEAHPPPHPDIFEGRPMSSREDSAAGKKSGAAEMKALAPVLL
jgi:hypothetical protein